ncbi:MAG: ABC transporter substrate-binding protein [Candidatus Dormibacteria bacterium]
MAVAACGSTSTSSSSPSTASTAGPPLIAEPTTGVTFSDDFNPYDGNSVAEQMGTRSMVNEPLIEYDTLDPTASGTHDWLASGYSFDSTGTKLSITIKTGIKFNNGTSFGPADVVATYAMLMNPKANINGMPTQSAAPTASGNVVTLTFATAQYTALYTILGNEYMLPASEATAINANPTMKVTDPVGTGPFMLDSYSSSLIKWKPNPYYWGGKPPESEIETPSLATNAAASDALVSGQLDWAGNDIPNVYSNYVDLNPQTNNAWFAAGSTVTLWFNLNTGNGGATGIGDAQVRKAVSYGIDRNALGLLGESGYEEPASSSSGLILPAQKSYLPSSGALTGDLSTSGNVPDAATAKADNLPTGDDVYDILTADGYTPPTSSSYDSSTGTYTKGGNCTSNSPTNCWEKGGQDISFSVYDPIAFSDYWEDCALISSALQAVGMDVTTKPAQGYSDWFSGYSASTSDWQTLIHWGSGGSIPYIQYEDWFDATSSTNSAAYTGMKDFSGDAAAATALTTYAATNPNDTSTIDTTVQSLENIMSTQVPYVPLLYGADWNVFSSADYTNWPNQSHPYMDPSPSDPQMPYILMQLKPLAS